MRYLFGCLDRFTYMMGFVVRVFEITLPIRHGEIRCFPWNPGSHLIFPLTILAVSFKIFFGTSRQSKLFSSTL